MTRESSSGSTRRDLVPNYRYALSCGLMASLCVFVAVLRLLDIGTPLPVLEIFVCVVAGVFVGFGMFLAGWAERLLEFRRQEPTEEEQRDSQ